MTLTLQDTSEIYAERGFISPIDVLTQAEAQALRQDFEQAEAELKDDTERLALLKAYPDRLLPAFDAVIRHPSLIAAAQVALGPDLMVWSGAMFIKEALSPKIVSWHQDLTYWGLDDAQETTLWLALSEASVASGCMQFVPGSHTSQIVPHKDTFADNNLLSRGQEIAVDVAEEDAVPAALKAGQASMHHGHLFHASGPNTTDDRRIGMAIRYIKPAMQQQNGTKSLVALAAGHDAFGHFEIAGPPRGRLHPDDFEMCRRDAARKEAILFAGAKRPSP